MAERSCGSCAHRFENDLPQSDLAVVGDAPRGLECRRYPPQVVFGGVNQQGAIHQIMFPSVFETWWCAEYVDATPRLMREVYESTFAVSLGGDIESAKKLSHDTVIQNTGRARRSAVMWSFFPARTAQRDVTASGSDLILPATAAALCAALPRETLVIATVQVDPDVTP